MCCRFSSTASSPQQLYLALLGQRSLEAHNNLGVLPVQLLCTVMDSMCFSLQLYKTGRQHIAIRSYLPIKESFYIACMWCQQHRLEIQLTLSTTAFKALGTERPHTIVVQRGRW